MSLFRRRSQPLSAENPAALRQRQWHRELLRQAVEESSYEPGDDSRGWDVEFAEIVARANGEPPSPASGPEFDPITGEVVGPVPLSGPWFATTPQDHEIHGGRVLMPKPDPAGTQARRRDARSRDLGRNLTPQEPDPRFGPWRA